MADQVNIREACADTLLDMDRSGKMSHIAIGEGLIRLQFASKQDRAFYTLLCEGTTERKIYLDYMLDHVSKTKMRKCRPFIRALLRMTAYQILFTDVRDAAACNEAVNIARKRGFKSLSGFVNGVLRGLIRNKDLIALPDKDKDPVSRLSVACSMPVWIVEKLTGLYGTGQTERMLEAFLEKRPTTIRVNRARISPEELAGELGSSGIKVEKAPFFSYAYHISDYNYLGRIPAFKQGLFTVQDVSSMLPAALADISPGDYVIDVCAAPGGKTFQAAELVGDHGRVLARDLTEAKTDLIRENRRRLACPQVRIEEWDARIADPDLFDKADLVIADLPCSGLGIMGRKNDIKYRISQDQIRDLVSLQREILSVVWKYVKPGGQLLFSTCTLTREENEENIDWICRHTPLIPVSIEDRLPVELKDRTGEAGYIKVLPGIDPGDGFFVAKFRRA